MSGCPAEHDRCVAKFGALNALRQDKAKGFKVWHYLQKNFPDKGHGTGRDPTDKGRGSKGRGKGKDKGLGKVKGKGRGKDKCKGRAKHEQEKHELCMDKYRTKRKKPEGYYKYFGWNLNFVTATITIKRKQAGMS